MTDFMKYAYFPNNKKTHLYENFNIGTIDLVSVPVYNELKADYNTLLSLKSGADKEYNDIISDTEYKKNQQNAEHNAAIDVIQNTADYNEKTKTETHNAEVNNRNKEYETLLNEKNALEKNFNDLEKDFKIKVAKIAELATKLLSIKTNRDAAVKIIKANIETAKQEYTNTTQRLGLRRTELNNKIEEFNRQQGLLNTEVQKITTLGVKFQNQSNKVVELDNIIDNLAKERITLDTEYNTWVAKFAALEEKFKKIEADISLYLKKGENNLEYITALLREKRLVQDKLFTYSEDKYNSQTHLIDDINLEMSPSELLENNQKREITKNGSKFSNLKNDIMSISKNIQINKNQYRKKSFYIFLLTNAFIFLVIGLIVVILMKKNYI